MFITGRDLITILEGTKGQVQYFGMEYQSESSAVDLLNHLATTRAVSPTRGSQKTLSNELKVG